MNHIKVIQSGVNVERIKSVLDQNPLLWQLHTFRQDFPGSPHEDTETIYLRGPKLVTEYQTGIVAQDWRAPQDALMQAAMDAILPALIAMNYTALGYAMIVKLKPGGWVTPHIDEGRYSDNYSRFHLVIADADGEAVLDVDPDPGSGKNLAEKYTSRTGDIIWFNHKALHTAINMHPHEDRIHLIFDATVPALGKPLYPR